MNYADTIAAIDREIEERHRQIEGLTKAKAILEELHTDTPTGPRRSGGRGRPTTTLTAKPAGKAKRKPAAPPADLRADPGADGVCDHEHKGGCRGAVDVAGECDLPGCRYTIRRCLAHDGGARGVPILLGIHRGHHRKAGDAVE